MTTAGFFTSVVDVIFCIYGFSFYVVTAARAGRTLPRLTIVAVLHGSVLTATMMIGPKQQQPLGDDARLDLLQALSNWVLAVNACLHVVGYTLLVLLYRHSVQTIFNRTLPKTLRKRVASFGAHLVLLRPLEIVARFVTAPWRTLPDILVLGEVRCGTTTLCQHLSSLNVQGPFCLWAHPELDHKESFYWVGHYLGYVSPYLYRMCFSWNHRGRTNNGTACSFDGCAQYLTSPTAPHLIAQAYRHAGQPPPILIACVRNPVDQAMSWWNYEQAAMQWGTSMELTEWNTSLRSSQYPPKTVMKALDFSSSDFVEDSYERAEKLVENNCHSLPPWAMTWPAGQLGAIGRSGMYASNIDRYERVFWTTFGNHNKASTTHTTASHRKCRYPMGSKYRYMNVIPLDDLKNETTLKVALTSIMEQVSERRQEMARHEPPPNLFSRLIATWFPRTNSYTDPHVMLSRLRTVRRNPSNPNTMTRATKEDEIRLTKLFAKDSKCLKELCGISFSE